MELSLVLFKVVSLVKLHVPYTFSIDDEVKMGRYRASVKNILQIHPEDFGDVADLKVVDCFYFG